MIRRAMRRSDERLNGTKLGQLRKPIAMNKSFGKRFIVNSLQRKTQQENGFNSAKFWISSGSFVTTVGKSTFPFAVKLGNYLQEIGKATMTKMVMLDKYLAQMT